MQDFADARKNMVDGQIHTAGVITPGILEAFRAIPREKFCPSTLKSIAYCDEDLPVGEGRFILSPSLHARMIQALSPSPGDVALDIGGANGYPAALMSSMVSTVIAVEEQEKFLSQAETLWQELGVCNVVGMKGRLNSGNAQHAPYNIIFINGAVAEIPGSLATQLCPGGRMIAVIRKQGHHIGKVTLVENHGDSRYSSRALFEAGAAYLPGFEPQTVFSL